MAVSSRGSSLTKESACALPCPVLCDGDVLNAIDAMRCYVAQAEGVTELTQKGFIDWCRNGSGYERKHLYDDKKLNEAVQVLYCNSNSNSNTNTAIILRSLFMFLASLHVRYTIDVIQVDAILIWLSCVYSRRSGLALLVPEAG